MKLDMQKIVREYNETANCSPTTCSVKDSGQRDTFQTGAVRDLHTGKGRYDLIPPEFMEALTTILEAGAVKYGDRNWEKGMPLCRTFDSCVRHLYQWMARKDDEKHAWHAAVNILFLIVTERRIQEGLLPYVLDDRPVLIPRVK